MPLGVVLDPVDVDPVDPLGDVLVEPFGMVGSVDIDEPGDMVDPLDMVESFDMVEPLDIISLDIIEPFDMLSLDIDEPFDCMPLLSVPLVVLWASAALERPMMAALNAIVIRIKAPVVMA